MDGLIEQMLDGLFRMAEKVTRAPYNLPPDPSFPSKARLPVAFPKGEGSGMNRARRREKLVIMLGVQERRSAGVQTNAYN